MAWLAEFYLWFKAFHVMSVLAWMAGLFYLPRLYVYHAEVAAKGSELSETFKIMERRLFRAIMNPAMISAWLFGLLMILAMGWPGLLADGWMWVKLVLISAMTWFHHSLGLWRKTFERDENTRPGRFYRMWNEAPTLLMAGIVIMVIMKPF